MTKLRIGYFADGPWSHKAFEKINGDQRFEIVFIVPRVDTQDQTLKNFSVENNIDYLHPVKINSPGFIEKVKKYECDIFVSMSFNQIFREPLISLPPLGTINCHAGKLPFYRGRNVLNWVLINDETEFGITVHYIDKGIDTGDIINQRTFPISDNDNYQSLLMKAYEECSNILYETLVQFIKGTNKRISQISINPVGFYCGGRGEGDERIDWNQSSRDIFNFIRAISYPGPKATSLLQNDILKINHSRLIKNSPIYKGIPGQILAKTENGYFVKTLDSIIEILDIESEIQIRIGDRLN